MKNNVLYYSVGPLLYCPANRISITDSLINERFGNRFSLALCLEAVSYTHLDVYKRQSLT